MSVLAQRTALLCDMLEAANWTVDGTQQQYDEACRAFRSRIPACHVHWQNDTVSGRMVVALFEGESVIPADLFRAEWERG